MQIRELEKDLGVDLVERRPGDVILTEVGMEVARRAEHVLAATRDLADFARHSGQPLTGRLRLGVIPTLAPYVLPRVLPTLQRRYPELRVELRETQTQCARRRARARRARRRAAGAAGERRRHRNRVACSTIRSCSPCLPSDPRPETARVDRARHRLRPADPAGRRPLPARSGARLSAPVRAAMPRSASARPAWQP